MDSICPGVTAFENFNFDTWKQAIVVASLTILRSDRSISLSINPLVQTFFFTNLTTKKDSICHYGGQHLFWANGNFKEIESSRFVSVVVGHSFA